MENNSHPSKLATLALACLSLLACQAPEKKQNLIQEDIDHAVAQFTLQTDLIEQSGQLLNPRTYEHDKILYVPIDDWCSGFFPGCKWYTNELPGQKK